MKEVKELLNKCDNCKLKECEGCEFTYTDIQKIKKYIENIETTNETLDKECSRLERNDFILDKVTEFLKEEPTLENVRVEASKIYKIIFKPQIEKTITHALELVNSYRKEILNIIEGENG